MRYTASSEVKRADDGAQLAWGADGSLTTRTLGADVTAYTSDALGRRTSTTTPGDTTSATYVYGFPVTTTDAVGETTTTTYESRGLTAGVTYSGGLAPTSVVHNALGRVTDASGQADYTYDVLNRVTAVAGPTGDVPYAYNAAGRLTGFETDGVGTFGVTWTADGMVDAVSYPNGVATDYMYDLDGRATGISVSGSGGGILDLGYGYTPGSLVSSRTTGRDGALPVPETMTLDAAARLSTISSMSSGVPVRYTASSEVTRADDGAQFAWGADGSLTTRTLGANVTTYASDALGRRTSTTTAPGDAMSLAWDQVGRMTGLTDTATGSQTDYAYSGGLRIGASTTVGAGTPDEVTSTESYTWDTLAGVPLLLADGSHEYIYGTGSSPVAQVDTVTGDVTFLHGDLVGSTRAATDASGAVVGTWDYTPFGVVTTATGGAAGDGAGVTRFLFAGEYQDDSGLTYLRARFYDPVTASFLSVDPALAQTGSPYAYASGNPLQLTDPLGLWPGSGLFDSVKSAVSSTVDVLSAGASATGNWIVDNKGILIGAAAGILVTAGCLAITAGVGSVGCAALGGAVGGMVTYGIDTPKECWTAGGFFVSGAIGGIIGGVTMGAGKALTPLVSKGFTAATSKASPAIRNAISRTVTALKPRSSAVDDLVEGAACSFAGPTAVVMADGSTKEIEDIQVGDEVLAEDPATGERGAHKVSHVWVHDDVMVDFAVEGGVVTTTEDHPFWNATDAEWEGPWDFDKGDRVLAADGNLLVTYGLVPDTWVTGTAFNLTVEDLHTYFVVIADEGVLVHNMCPTGMGFEPPTPAGTPMSSPGNIANKLGVGSRDVRTAIERIKSDWGRMGGSGRNPDVVVDETGEVFPKGPDGLGDSIGNLWDYLPGSN